MSQQTSSDPKPIFKTTIGGQALIEGIMMQGPDKTAVVIRKSDGTLEKKIDCRRAMKDTHPVLGLPLIRGVVNFGSSMINATKALYWSADFYSEDDEENPEASSRFDQWLQNKVGERRSESFLMIFAATFSLLFSVALFFLLPTFIAGFFSKFFSGPVVFNLMEGCIRIAIFLLYLIFCSRLSNMRRVFSYHGAEHKTISCYEAGLPLTTENVRLQTRFHPRCGTSFLFVIIVISILCSSIFFPFIEWQSLWIRIGFHLLLLPAVVSISYEINHLVGRYDNFITRIFIWPGLWLQNFTTFEPDDSMIEVGIEALKLVIPDIKGKDIW